MLCNHCGKKFKPESLNQLICNGCNSIFDLSDCESNSTHTKTNTVSAAELNRGIIKWFSTEKGYGFVVGEDNVERYFHVKEVNGVALPSNGDSVTFDSIKADKCPKAINLSIIKKAKTPQNDNQVKCSHCGKNMIPRIITGPPIVTTKGGWTPVPVKSICPFCAGTYKQFDRKMFGSGLEMVGAAVALVIILFVAMSLMGHR